MHFKNCNHYFFNIQSFQEVLNLRDNNPRQTMKKFEEYLNTKKFEDHVTKEQQEKLSSAKMVRAFLCSCLTMSNDFFTHRYSCPSRNKTDTHYMCWTKPRRYCTYLMQEKPLLTKNTS